MAVAIETFECSETAAEPIEATEEAVRLMEELGLAGQQEFVRPRGDKPAARSPYREITAEESFVYRVLCPVSEKLHRYRASPIPLRVLQIAAHAKSLGLFDEFEVWDRASVEVKDPVLVASCADKQWTWQRKTFILARWGEVLEPFSVLLKRAVDQKRKEFSDAVDQITAQVAAERARVAAMLPQDVIKLGPTAKLSMGFTQ